MGRATESAAEKVPPEKRAVRRLSWHNLTVQMVIGLTLLVLLTAVATGLPAILLIRDQIERQAWVQVNQGKQASQALYRNWLATTNNLAMLTSQRPTLQQLAAAGQEEPLTSYLETLQAGTDLDLLLFCAPDRQPLAAAGLTPDESLCAVADAAALHVLESEAGQKLWLLAAHEVSAGPADLGRVVVGIALDDEFAALLASETGVEHTLLAAGQPLASSLAGGPEVWLQGSYQPVETNGVAAERARFSLGDRPYYVERLALDGAGTEDELALDVTEIAATRARIEGVMIASILTVILVASSLGVLLANRVGRPLAELAGAAQELSQGKLDEPIHVPVAIDEVTQLGQSLESARVNLSQMMADLRQANEWNVNLLEAISEGIVTLDRLGRITFFSPGAERITGLTAAEVLGKPSDEIFQLVDRLEPFSSYLPPPGRQSKVTIALADGREITLSITGAHMLAQQADESAVALVFRDVSEAELMHRFMGEFLANITHEFRTPISALAASSELLLDQAADLSPQELNGLLTSLYMGIVSLQTLVDNLLESARLEAGRFQVYQRPTDLAEIIAEASRIMQPLLDKHNQHLSIELPAALPVVQADGRRITQVLVNLLANANKYSPEQSEIGISVSRDGDWVRVAVIDQGPGIASEHQPAIFRRFARPDVENGKGRYGVGLGLSVVRATIEAHGGQVGVEDRPGGGSIFWFTLAQVDVP